MTPELLRDDCQRCAALCCIALAFDKSALFAFDKPAGAPCKHLTDGFGCAVHATRMQAGFAGCHDFTCHGAGQRVVQECFDGRDWRAEPGLLARMINAFRTARHLHETLTLLTDVQKLPISPSDRRRAEGYIQMLSPPGPMTEDWLNRVEHRSVREEVLAFLRGLAPSLNHLKPGQAEPLAS